MGSEGPAHINGATTITVRDAFLAMFDYLVNRWEAKSHPEFLATLLGDIDPHTWKALDLPPDAVSTGDPAAWDDWLEVVRRIVLSSGDGDT
jgi:hypothetical protein